MPLRLILTLILLPALAPAAEPEAFDRLTFHQAPTPLSASATTADWPRLLGPSDDAFTPEQPLALDFPPSGPPKVWEVQMGEGYAGPAISGFHLVIFHALDGRETIECLHPETGKRYWQLDYPITYRDRYGFADGPRGSPTIADDIVVTLGVTSLLTAIDLQTGTQLWQKDLRRDYHVPQDFFGHGSSPLIHDGKVIVQVGGKAQALLGNESKKERSAILASTGTSVAAFDLRTGEPTWELSHTWGASYASPLIATLHNSQKLLVFAGGESDPPTGGLLCIDPATGQLHSEYPWRADDYISATASSPTVIPEKNRVFITTCYPKNRPLGGAMIEFNTAFQPTLIWQNPKIGVHWMTPVHHEGHLYAVDGERENNSRLICVNADTGSELWSQTLTWEDLTLTRNLGRSNPVRLGFLRGSLLRTPEGFIGLGELGTLLSLQLSPQTATIRAQAPLFYATNTWSLPAISRGLLYVCQQGQDMDISQNAGPRILCFDLRPTEP